MPVMNGELSDWLQARLAALRAERDPQRTLPEALPALLLASDYAFDRLRRQPDLLDGLDRPPAALDLREGEDGRWMEQLRRFRHRHSLALIAAEVAGAPLESTLAYSSWIADHCLQQAHNAAFRQLAARHGRPRSSQGESQSLVVMALGKLGGSELNFSSDIDLVFAYPEAGSSDGERALDNETFFQRLGQRLIQLLGEVTADGFGFRVDMRLRPFGNAGRLALSFAAMEQYYQRDGRDWERYAWIKARPVAGDLAAGGSLLAMLRPFVFRRYLDYTAFEGLREMKALIEAEVQRRDLAGHLKLGPGGIREIEFIVQLQQLIRGGREPALRRPGLLAALTELEIRGYLQRDVAERLRAAYAFLRRLENRVQMLRDEQTHELPTDPLARARIAHGLGFSDWDALNDVLQAHRELVRREFTRVFEAREQRPQTPQSQPLREYWRQIEHAADAAQLEACGIAEAQRVHPLLQSLAASMASNASAQARQRLDRLMPDLLAAAARQNDVFSTMQRLVALLQAVLRRPSYLALLDEQPAALQRLVEVMARSGLLAERIAAHPILLDDLLDARAEIAPPNAAETRHAIDALLARHAGDVEQALNELNEIRQSVAFRIGLATLFQRQSAETSAAQLAELAECLVAAVLPLAVADLRPAHGLLPGHGQDAGLGVVGYGSLGGRELGFGSDLDLVFLFDAGVQGQSTDGPRPLDATRYQLRVVQKIIALLSTLTAAGRLYEVDLRLRPDGAKGLLLVSVQSFADYQRERAWTWEHQALVRARPVCGDRHVCDQFAAVREQVLTRVRDVAATRRDVVQMRQRMRQELDRGQGARFDLKQGRGGLVDLEFMLQYGVLSASHECRELPAHTRSAALVEALAACAAPWSAHLDALRRAHALLLQRSLECTLDARPRLVTPDAAVSEAREAIAALWSALEFATEEAVASPAPARVAAREETG